MLKNAPISKLASTSLQLTAGVGASVAFELKILQNFMQDVEGKLKAVENVKRDLSQLVLKLESINSVQQISHIENARLWLIKAIQADSPKLMLYSLGHALHELRSMGSMPPAFDLPMQDPVPEIELSQQMYEHTKLPIQNDQSFLQTDNYEPSRVKRVTPILLFTILGMAHTVKMILKASAHSTTPTKQLLLYLLREMRAMGWKMGDRLDSNQQKTVMQLLRKARQEVVTEFEGLVDEIGRKLRQL